jgi:hypothetical protein
MFRSPQQKKQDSCGEPSVVASTVEKEVSPSKTSIMFAQSSLGGAPCARETDRRIETIAMQTIDFHMVESSARPS